MINEQQTPELDLRDVEAELCRLPDVAAVRIVSNESGRPVEVHVLANTSKHAKQVVRDIQSVALASFGLEIDRRIVSVVQLGPNGAGTPEPEVVHEGNRTTIVGIQSNTGRLRTTIQVTLSSGGDEAVGFAEGSIATNARLRIVAAATLDALRQLVPTADSLDIDTVHVERIGDQDVVVVTLVCIDPPLEHSLSGSAIVRQVVDDAVARAVLNSTNRRLPFLREHNGA
jgi:hypothetical protein